MKTTIAKFCAATVAVVGSFAFGADLHWRNGYTGSVAINTNWEDDTLPGTGDKACIENAGEDGATLSAGETWNVGQLNVGANGTYRQILTVSGGTLNLGGEMDIGNWVRGTLAISGGTVTFKRLMVGTNGSGDGVLNIFGGEMTSTSTEWFSLGGWSSSSTGVVNQTGGLFSMTQAPVQLGTGGATGIYNLFGGTLSVPYIQVESGTSELNISGGTLKAVQNEGDFIHNGSQGDFAISVGPDGMIVDTDGHDITINVGIAPADGVRDGGLTKLGNGKLTITGNYALTGPINVEEGIVDMRGKEIACTGGRVADGARLIANYKSAQSDGPTFGNYTYGAVSATGEFKIPNALNALLGSAVAWYDPSDTSTLTLDGTDIHAIANKGKAGGVLDQRKRYAWDDKAYPQLVASDDNMPGLVDGLNVVRMGNDSDTYTFWSLHRSNDGFNCAAYEGGCVVMTNNQPRAVFGVGFKDNNQYSKLGLLNIQDCHVGDSSWGWQVFTGWFGIYYWEAEDQNWLRYYDIEGGSEDISQGVPKYLGAWDISSMLNKATVSYMVQDAEHAVSGRRTVSDGTTVDVVNATPATVTNTGASTNAVSYASPYMNNMTSAGAITGETLLYDRDLSAAEIAAIDTYLKHKWLGTEDEPVVPNTVVESLTLAEGAVVDLDGGTAAIAEIAGTGTISNGVLTGTIAVNGNITLDSTASLSNATLVVTVNADGTLSGTITFTRDVDLSTLTLQINGENYRSNMGPLKFLTTTNGAFSGRFAAVQRSASGRCDPVIGANSVDIGPRKGFVIVVR